ncbi:MAG: DUF4097 domain-containing protein [Candidatus Aminicenantia bacterium]
MKKICLLAAFLILLTSCVIVVENPSDVEVALPINEFHKIIYLDPGGTISLENINGNIEIHGWDKEEVEIFAEKIIPRGYERRVYWLWKNYSQPKVHLDKFENFIKIKTQFTGKNQEENIVDYYLKVPRPIELKDISNTNGDIFISDLYGEAIINLINGKVEVENFSGSLSASTANGSIKASLYDLREEDQIRLTTKQGNITIYLQPEVNAQIEAKTSNGTISSEFDLNQTLPAEKISSKIGQGGVLISLSTLNGNIKIKKL